MVRVNCQNGDGGGSWVGQKWVPKWVKSGFWGCESWTCCPLWTHFGTLTKTRLFGAELLGRGCDEAHFSEKKGFSVKRREAFSE